ncbi:MAG: diguanylate cyclase [FCB group bacterium]|jgi:diguanylate cyclase (GGDEF)-like protein|nr:diguanylate cyclase [FCB group bacterium]
MLANYRVCVVDDCPDTAQILCDGLELNGYQAVSAATGAEALEKCKNERFDLVLLDIGLPDISGYEVCQRLKEAPETADIVVVFVTAKGSKEDIVTGFKLGAADYITKPYNLPMVIVRVEAAMRMKELQDKLRQQDEMLQDTAYTDSLTGLRNRRYLLERLQEEVEKAHRYNYPVSCIVFDLDEIEALDDELGAAPLDDLLAEMGLALRNYSRTFDIVARYDGTLFAAVLPHTPLDQAIGYADKIMREINCTTFADPCFPTQAKVSVGIACCRNGNANGAEFVLGEAMHGLLQAKSKPDNRLVARNLAEA